MRSRISDEMYYHYVDLSSQQNTKVLYQKKHVNEN